eukprot:TRINITY_DN7709_c0_g1_i2.p1 TRINITY_DN7709_c0_g1~~TRINITY_DN7709_c0_g1_i2.p1  ORF type:complete len:380 (+),score=51.99 TRINITY_DN7709_c0_g1_i2:87-1226(+)
MESTNPSKDEPIYLPHNVCFRKILRQTDAIGRVYWAFEIYITDKTSFVIQRRYSHFYSLHEALKKKFPEVSSLTFPPKSPMRTIDADMLEHRRSMLELYVRSLLNIPLVRSCQELVDFLEPKNDGCIIPAVMEGYLWKQGHFIRNWKKRWFILRSGVLQYFESERESKSKGDISLLKAVICMSTSSPEPNTLEITTATNVTYYIRAENEEEAQKWLAAIREQSIVTSGGMDEYFSDDRSERSVAHSFVSSSKKASYEIAKKSMLLDERQKDIEQREAMYSERLKTYNRETETRELKEMEAINLLKILLSGISLNKLSHGKIHKRFLWATDNMLYLCWAEGGKKEKSKKSLFVYDIRKITKGSSDFSHANRSFQKRKLRK